MSRPPFQRRIVADDLGASPGVNRAIARAFREGGLTHASLVATAPYAEAAVDLVRGSCSRLQVGLHLNLTSGRPAADPAAIPALVGPDGRFRHGFTSLLGLCRRSESVREQIRIEAEAQIRWAEARGLRLTHLDGHRHVHMIPAVFQVLREAASVHGIERIRVINESLVWTLKTAGDVAGLFHPNVIKYVLLKSLTRAAGARSDIYFFSILYSCRLTPERVRRAVPPPGFAAIEIMLHPGEPAADRTAAEAMPGMRTHLLSAYRERELEACLALGNIESHGP